MCPSEIDLVVENSISYRLSALAIKINKKKKIDILLTAALSWPYGSARERGTTTNEAVAKGGER